MKTFLSTLFVIVSCCTGILAQQEGSIRVVQDPAVDTLLERHIKLNEQYKDIDGFRIQVYMDSGNDAVDLARERIEAFEEQFPGVPAYLSFSSPYYRVRVGDFRTRLEAEGFLKKIETTYPNAWVIPSKIYYPNLKNHTNEEEDHSGN